MDVKVALTSLCEPGWISGSAHATRHHEEVLAALLPASRTSSGRALVGGTSGAIEALAAVLRDPLVFLEPMGVLCVHIMRNLCARCGANQRRAAAAGIHAHVLRCIDRRVEVSDAFAPHADGTTVQLPAAVRRLEAGNEMAEDHMRLKHPFFTFAVQFLCNFVTGNKENAEQVWKLAYPVTFLRILECQNVAAAAAGTALLHNCIAAHPARANDLVTVRWRSDSEGTELSMIEFLVEAMGKDNLKEGSEIDERFSWSFMVIHRLVSANLLQEVFDSLGPSLEAVEKSSTASFSSAQFVLLEILEATTAKSVESGGEDSTDFDIPEESLSFFSRLVSASWERQDGTTLRLACSLAGSVILLMPESDRVSAFKVPCTTVAVTVLAAMCRQGPQISSLGDSKSFAGLRGAAVRLIALAADQDKGIQDLVRNLDGLIPVLATLSYEADTSLNPFLREWGVLAVRNLCLENAQNGDEIAKLELQDVQSKNDVLEGAGLEVYLDEESKKPKLRVKPVETSV